jgi:hypothetical protein
MPAFSQAGVLTANLTADNSFDFYISTSDSTLGTLIGSGNDWGTTFSFSPTLADGSSYYLHVAGNNSGGPGAFIGDFSLSGAFKFTNGTQSLLSNTTDWSVSPTGFGSGYVTPTDYGANGVVPWGTRSGISSSAHWIWVANSQAAVAYFSTPIIATASSAPEPATLAATFVGLGLTAGVVAIRRRRRA